MAERIIAELTIGQDVHVTIKRFTHMDNKLNVHLKPCQAYCEFTMSFRQGQVMSLAAVNLMKTNKNFRKLISMWNKYHLNTLSAGSYKQNLFLHQRPDLKNNYDVLCRELSRVGLNDEYRYGSQWLVKEIPNREIYKTIKAMIAIEETLRPTPRLRISQDDYEWLIAEYEARPSSTNYHVHTAGDR